MESTYGGAAKQRALFVSFDGNFHGDLVCEYHETFLLDSEISLLRFMLFREGIKKKKFSLTKVFSISAPLFRHLSRDLQIVPFATIACSDIFPIIKIF